MSVGIRNSKVDNIRTCKPVIQQLVNITSHKTSTFLVALEKYKKYDRSQFSFYFKKLAGGG